MPPDLVGGHGVVGRQVLGALAGGDDLEAAGARPINDLAGQRRLVAIRERIDGALGSRLSGQERTGEHVGFYIDHDNVLAGSDRCAGMGNPGGRATGRLDNDLDLRIGARFGSRRDKRVRAIRGASHPTVQQALRARSGSRSAMTETSSPDFSYRVGFRAAVT